MPTKADKLAGNIIQHYRQIGDYKLEISFTFNGKRYQKRNGFKQIGYESAKANLHEWFKKIISINDN